MPFSCRWEKGETIWENDEGEKTIEYISDDTPVRIQSRKRNIPHANGIGYWQHTFYVIVMPDGTEFDAYSVKSAKHIAERITREMGWDDE